MLNRRVDTGSHGWDNTKRGESENSEADEERTIDNESVLTSKGDESWVR